MYQNYFPATYQPYQFPQQPVQQNTSSILWVRDSQEAAMYPVAPNNAVALWDSSAPAIYLKQADASGRPTIRTYDLVERVDAKESYATKTEMAALANLVNAVDNKVNSLKESLKQREDDDDV